MAAALAAAALLLAGCASPGDAAADDAAAERATAAGATPGTTGSEEVTGPAGATTSDRTAAPSADLPTGLREVYLAGGCFWGVEAYMARIDGVVDAVSGYANGRTEEATYEDLRTSGHAETVRVWYDPARITLDEILLYYVRIIDPTSVDRQGPDSGEQYRTGIFWTDVADEAVVERRLAWVQQDHEEPVAIEAEPLANFVAAEDHHQDYLDKNPGGYCHIDLALADTPVIRVSDHPRPGEEELREQLSDLQYRVTQEGFTEPAHDNLYNQTVESGIYVDVVTGEPLFSSRDKFDSGTGWPSFTAPIVPYVVTYDPDAPPVPSGAEVRSRAGDSHLGHVFDDGPTDRGGRRYCINSAALRFVPEAAMAAEGYGALLESVG